MGGYAALKYSRMLKATNIIALCPQWTIDPNECDGTNPGWQTHFKREMSGMSIKHSDTSGSAYVFFDPFNPTDTFHAHKICNYFVDITLIQVPFVNHNVTPCMAGTEAFQNLKIACQGKNINVLRQISRHQRRRSGYYRNELATRAVSRRPKLTFSFILKHKNSTEIPKLCFTGPYLIELAEQLYKQGHLTESLICFDFCKAILLPPSRRALVVYLAAEIFKRNFFLSSFHKTVLVYNLRSFNCRHVSIANLDAKFDIPVSLVLKGRMGHLVIKRDNFEIYLGVSLKGELPVDEDSAAEFNISRTPDNKFNFSHNNKFLSAEPNGNLICNRQDARDWEKFDFEIV